MDDSAESAGPTTPTDPPAAQRLAADAKRRWAIENADFITAYNALVAEFGIWHDTATDQNLDTGVQ